MTTENERVEHFGRIAYEAYREASEGYSLPEWDRLKQTNPKVADTWMYTGQKIREAL